MFSKGPKVIIHFLTFSLMTRNPDLLYEMTRKGIFVTKFSHSYLPFSFKNKKPRKNVIKKVQPSREKHVPVTNFLSSSNYVSSLDFNRLRVRGMKVNNLKAQICEPISHVMTRVIIVHIWFNLFNLCFFLLLLNAFGFLVKLISHCI